ncbi:MAG: hypothetical protein ACLTS6_04145 [Anaerobutyricum sp.]
MEIRKFIRTLENRGENTLKALESARELLKELEGDNPWTYEEIFITFSRRNMAMERYKHSCPAHPDKEASLTITQGNNGRTFIKMLCGLQL